MSRALVLGVVAVALAGSPALAAPRRPRVVTQRYEKPAAGEPGTATVGFCWTVHRPAKPAENHGCVRFEPGARERWASFAITDDTGLPVRGKAYQGEKVVAHFCGESEPVPIRDEQIVLWLLSQPAPDLSCPGTATTGSVRGEFR